MKGKQSQQGREAFQRHGPRAVAASTTAVRSSGRASGCLEENPSSVGSFQAAQSRGGGLKGKIGGFG